MKMIDQFHWHDLTDFLSGVGAKQLQDQTAAIAAQDQRALFQQMTDQPWQLLSLFSKRLDRC